MSRLKQDDREQSRLFIKKAREIGADEKHSVSDALLAKLRSSPPQPRTKRKRKSKSK